jgi:hypothetical protein
VAQSLSWLRISSYRSSLCFEGACDCAVDGNIGSKPSRMRNCDPYRLIDTLLRVLLSSSSRDIFVLFLQSCILPLSVHWDMGPGKQSRLRCSSSSTPYTSIPPGHHRKECQVGAGQCVQSDRLLPSTNLLNPCLFLNTGSRLQPLKALMAYPSQKHQVPTSDNRRRITTIFGAQRVSKVGGLM